jgi:hypothetical protein
MAAAASRFAPFTNCPRGSEITSSTKDEAMKISPSLRRRGLLAAACIALFTVTGFFILPPIIKSQLEQRLSSELGRRVKVGKVRLNPYALSLTLENFAIQERDGTTLFLGWRRLYVNFNALSSIRGDWVLGEVALDGFTMRGQINPDQSLNVADLIEKFAPPAAAAPPPNAPEKPARPIRINRLRVSDARISLTDLSRKQPFATTLGPLNFDLTGFRTVPDRDAPYHFEAVTEAGEKLTWSGTLRAEPFQSAGELSLENIVLSKYAPYYADRVRADIVSGKLSVRGRYEIDLTADHRVLRLRDGSLQLRGVELRERGATEAAVELPALDIAGVQADALTQKATVSSVALAGGHIRVRREKDGSINLLTMLQPPAPVGASPPAVGPSPAAPPAPAANLPDVTLGDLALKDFQVDVTDLAAPRPAQLALNSLQFSLKNVTLAEGAQMPLHLAFGWAPAGSVKIDGSVAIAPIKADLKIAVAGLEFLPLSPYLEQFVNARLAGGAVTAALDAQLSLPPKMPLAATVAGDVTIEKLSLVDGARSEDLAGLSGLTLRGLRAGTAPELTVALDEIDLAGPYARVVVNSDKTLNLAMVAKTASPSAAAPPGAAERNEAPASTLPKIEIGRIAISDGDYRFTDRSLDPNVSMAIDHFGGTVGGFSSTNLAKADVDLKALVDGDGPVSITGKLDPLGPNKRVDLKIDFKNVDLLPLSSYSGKFAGYDLARGKLALDVKFLLDGKKIDASNVITLNQFTFGNPVESPDATHLPVRLGVALLKDTDGQIVIDVPIQGTTDDPNFRIGRVVLRVVVNLLTKAAVSPFSLLGAAFGGGGDELGYQEFAPGSAEIQPGEVKKLQTMTLAMANRPGLSLGLEGSYDTAADSYALKRLKLADQVRRAIWETKHLANPNIPPPAQLVITPAETAAEIKKLFDEKFPPGTQFGTPLPPPPAVVAPPPPAPGFFKRLIREITFQPVREKRAARRENARLQAEHTQAVAAASAAGLPVEEMSGRLAEAITVDDNDLRTLAQARAQRVRDYFANVGKIAPDRLFLAHVNSAKEGKGPRVFLELQ